MRAKLDRPRVEDDAAHRYADWSRVHRGLVRFVDEAQSFRGLPGAQQTLRRGERAFLALSGVHLIEPRPSGGRFVPSRTGDWLRISAEAFALVRGEPGLFVPGFEQPESVDVGDLVVTDRRALLHGSHEDHEWSFSEVTAVHHDPDGPWTALEIPDGAGPSGFFYGHADVALVRFRLGLALAVYGGSVARLRHDLEAALTRHLEAKPPFP